MRQQLPALVLIALLAGCAVEPGGEASPVPESPGHFEALGQEPGWLLEIRREGKITFDYNYGQEQLVVSTPEPEWDNDGHLVYHSQSSAQDLQVTLIEEQCTDVMSGRRFPFTVIVRLDGERFEGCGNPTDP